MEIDQLKAFVSLTKTKNFSKTAEVLHLVQSTISTRIQQLEMDLGKKLFYREHKSLSLTPAGMALLPYADRVLTLISEGSHQIRTMDTFDDQIGVGCSDSLARHVLQNVLIEFCRLRPKIALSIKTGHSAEITEYLMDGVIHLGFVYVPPNLPGIQVQRVLNDDFILAASPRHPKLKLGQCLSVRDLPNFPLISVDWDQEFASWQRRLLPPNYQPPIQPDLLNTLIGLIRNRRGAAFLPRYAARKDLEKGNLVELTLQEKDIAIPKRKAYVIYRKEKRLRPSVKFWLQLLKAHQFPVRVPK